MQRQVLERFDLRSLPALLLRPVDGQHVVGELFAEHQRGGVGLRLACRVAFDGEIRRLGWRGTREPTAGREEDGTRAERATDTVIVFKSSLLAGHALKISLGVIQRHRVQLN